ncbi:hypothetical protein CDL15_Pgr007503 [Punica granatum]|uniref:AAA+ ATPase domain-containing protein n=1 Tax=Punica granatum TaxID=22663 RepID=A0A218X8C6_PUNGR|nr:hypothetical protein CDL15_Pgr007503 [Punica granatum]
MHSYSLCALEISDFIEIFPPKQMLRSLHSHLHTPSLAPSSSHRCPKSPPFSFHFPPRPFPLRKLGKSLPGHRRNFPGCSASSSVPEDDFEVEQLELARLLDLLPEGMRRRVTEHPELHQLIEVVMDLGRKPLARFPSGDFVLSDCPITHEDLGHATSQVGDFAVDNRAGISRTLHRISAIRNRKGTIIGLTCRVGRAISGSAPLLRDLVQNGASLLLIGPPGVGKTTIIREIARMLANDYRKRVMIVDTSNEIGGDGDIPHAGIGNARRMQVPDSDMQHKVLIEAVENHMPQVIVIDEIGTKLEAMAASTIAQRGIQLVATAHGVTIENVIMNPALEMLSVTLGDEEASRRRVQKTVLERKGPATFNSAVEIVSKTELRIHRSLEATVDFILSGRPPNVEVRKIGLNGSQEILMEPLKDSFSTNDQDIRLSDIPEKICEIAGFNEYNLEPRSMDESKDDEEPIHLYAYGVMKQLEMSEDAILITDDISKADALLASQSKLKKNPRIQAAASFHGIPTYVTKTSSMMQITKALRALMREREVLEDLETADKSNSVEIKDALEEARVAIEQVVIPKGEPAVLLPRSPHVMTLQIELIRKYGLQSEQVVKEPDVRLRILPFHAKIDEGNVISSESDGDDEFDEFDSSSSVTNGSIYRISRLPLLPD